MSTKRSRGSLTREAVVNAALLITDREGIDAVTIRSVADFLGAPPMSLYSHIASKEELLDLMHGEVSRRVYDGPAQATWQYELFALCQRLRSLLHEHPPWASLAVRPSAALPLLPARDRVLQLMSDDGFSVEGALQSLMGILTVAFALLKCELDTQGPDGKSLITARLERTRGQSSSAENASSLTHSAVSRLARFDLADLFSLTVRAVIRELELTLSNSGPKSSAAPG